MAQQTKPAAQEDAQRFTPSKPNFIKLRENQSLEGVFICKFNSQYGAAYKFRNDKGEIISLGGNRAQLDQIFDEVLGNPQGFVGDTLIGHYLRVERGINTTSHSGRKVAQYALVHVRSKCAKGCKS